MFSLNLCFLENLFLITQSWNPKNSLPDFTSRACSRFETHCSFKLGQTASLQYFNIFFGDELTRLGSSRSELAPFRRTAPLNGTFFAALTDEMTSRPELVQTFTVYQGRNSSRSPACVSADCVKAKICYMRSGSAILGKQCPPGFASVQG